MRIVIPFDGSDASLRAIQYVIELAGRMDKERLSVDLVNVQADTLAVAEVFARDANDVAARLTESSRKTGNQVLGPALAALEEARIPTESFVLIGEPAATIAEHVATKRANAIVMGTRGLGTIGGLVLGSVASKVIHLVTVPVTLVR